MDSARSETILNTVPLLNAVLCADCEVISDSSGEVCSVCGSRSLLNLGRVLGGSVGQERAVILPEEEENPSRRMFTVLVNREASAAVRPLRRWVRPERVVKAGS